MTKSEAGIELRTQWLVDQCATNWANLFFLEWGWYSCKMWIAIFVSTYVISVFTTIYVNAVSALSLYLWNLCICAIYVFVLYLYLCYICICAISVYMLYLYLCYIHPSIHPSIHLSIYLSIAFCHFFLSFLAVLLGVNILVAKASMAAKGRPEVKKLIFWLLFSLPCVQFTMYCLHLFHMVYFQ